MSRKETTAPDLPPLDPEALAEAARRVMQKKKPASGWPGTPPKELTRRWSDNGKDG